MKAFNLIFEPAKIHTLFLKLYMGNLSDKGVSYLAGFFMLIAFAIGGSVIGLVLSIPIVSIMSGNSLSYIANNLQLLSSNPAFFRELQVMQILTSGFGFLAPVLFTASRLSRNPIGLTGLKGVITSRQLLLTLFIIGGGLALSGALGYFTYKLPLPVDWRIRFDRMEADYAAAASNLINVSSIPEFLMSILVLAIVPAVCEEAFFRGGLQNYMYRHTQKFWLSVIVVSIIFSAVHFSFYGFLSRLALGIILGLLYQYSGRLWLSILAHFINNAAAVLAIYVAQSTGKSIQQVLSEKDGSYWGLLVIPIIILLLIQFKNSTHPNAAISNGI